MKANLLFFFLLLASCLVGQDLRPVQQDGKWGFCDMDGKIVIPCSFDTSQAFVGNQALVRKNGRYALITKAGKLSPLPKADQMDWVIDSVSLQPIFFVFKRNELFGTADLAGGILSEPEFSEFIPIGRRTFMVKLGDLYGLLGATGMQITLFKYLEFWTLPNDNKNILGLDEEGAHFVDIETGLEHRYVAGN